VAAAYLRDPGIGLVLLDELTYAFKYQWLPLDEVLAAFAARPPMQHVIVTGRAAPEALIDAADTVTEMQPVKHAFKAGIKAMPGMEF
jgi:cob(I)alamin adenosyltransferase